MDSWRGRSVKNRNYITPASVVQVGNQLERVVYRDGTLYLFVFGIFRTENVDSAFSPDYTAPIAHDFDR